MTIIAIKPFNATNTSESFSGETFEQPCEVVGVHFVDGEYQLVVIVREDGSAWAKAVDSVELIEPGVCRR